MALLLAGQLSLAGQNHPTENLSKLLPQTVQPQSAKSDFEKAMEKSQKIGDEDPKKATERICILPVAKIPLKKGQNPTDVKIPNPPVPQGPKFPIQTEEDHKSCIDRGGTILYSTPTAGH